MIFEMPSCGGCKTCEMACSYRHSGEFKPEISSIQILEKESELGYLVLIVEDDVHERKACDNCNGQQIPLCVLFCEKSEDLKGVLEEYRKKVQSRKK
jgi:Fe-S-cluster-containing hydrogenase component 2